MDFLLYEPEDFAADESYLKFYFRLNEADTAFWQQWISNHPEKLDSIINADQLINLLALQLDEGEFAQEYQRLSEAIRNLEPAATKEYTGTEGRTPCSETVSGSMEQIEGTKKKISITPVKKVLLLSLLCLLLAGTYFTAISTRKSPISADLRKTGTLQILKRTNTSSQPAKFVLEDGSIITLQPGSALRYPDHFTADKREVSLEGEAFFEVSKNKKRPFYVYCQNLVAHVLGTSFNIKSDTGNGKVEVTVSTGNVELYQNEELAAQQGKGIENIILSPNQKAVYLVADHQFEAALADVPLPINYNYDVTVMDSIQKETTYQRAVPMSEMVESLEKSYGIDIELANTKINNCHFSGDLPDMNLYLKLDVICQSINATCEVKGNKILISGRGCK